MENPQRIVDRPRSRGGESDRKLPPGFHPKDKGGGRDREKIRIKTDRVDRHTGRTHICDVKRQGLGVPRVNVTEVQARHKDLWGGWDVGASAQKNRVRTPHSVMNDHDMCVFAPPGGRREDRQPHGRSLGSSHARSRGLELKLA